MIRAVEFELLDSSIESSRMSIVLDAQNPVMSLAVTVVPLMLAP